MATIVQPTLNPTNKLTASVVAVAIIELARVLVNNFWPGFDDAALWTAVAPLLVFAVGYFIKDEANVIVGVPTDKTQTTEIIAEIKPVNYQDL